MKGIVPLEILYSDKHIAVCKKEIGENSQDTKDGVPEKIREALGGEVFTVHRLDLNVGGVMVYARTKQAAAKLSQQIQEGELKKEYLAVVNGEPNPKADRLVDFLFKDSSKNKVFVVKKQRKGVKEARLDYDVVKTVNDKSLVHIILDTGRSHQIRVQFASRKWPLIGDHKYGSKDSEKNPALFSSKLTFNHPITKEKLSFESTPNGEIWDSFI